MLAIEIKRGGPAPTEPPQVLCNTNTNIKNNMSTNIQNQSAPQELMTCASRIDEIINQSTGLALTGVQRSISIAQAIQNLRSALSPEIMEPIMCLQGSPLGFRTDKDTSGGYPVNMVKECIISAWLKGVETHGNQLNIIGGRDYITKEGFTHLLAKIHDLSYRIDLGLASLKTETNDKGEEVTKGAIVKPKITWSYKEQENDKTLELAIRVNKGMGHDAILGKAERKAKAWLYNEITGNNYTDADAEDAMPERNVTPVSKESAEPAIDNPMLSKWAKPKQSDIIKNPEPVDEDPIPMFEKNGLFSNEEGDLI